MIDASNSIVMPGFVDTHRHMWQGFLRNVLPDGSLADYAATVQRKFGANMVPEDNYAADLLSALGVIDGGVTMRARLVAHPTFAGAHRRLHQGIAGVWRAGGVRLRRRPQTVSGNWKEAAKAKFPGDIARLRKQYFSSDDQFLTLFLASPGGAPPEVNSS